MPELDDSFDCFIPVNEVVWKIKKLILKSISDLTNSNLNLSNEYVMISVESGRVYDNNDIVVSTDIRNGSELILMIKK